MLRSTSYQLRFLAALPVSKRHFSDSRVKLIGKLKDLKEVRKRVEYKEGKATTIQKDSQKATSAILDSNEWSYAVNRVWIDDGIQNNKTFLQERI